MRAQQFPDLFPFTIPFLLPPAHLQFSVSSAPFCTFLPSKEFKGLTLQYRICSAIFLLAFIPKSKLIQPCQDVKKHPSHSGENPHPHIYNSGRKHIYWSKLHKPRAFKKKKKHAATYNKIEHTKIDHLLGIKILTINCHFIVLNDIKEEFLLFSFRKLFLSNIMTMMLEKFQQQFQFYIYQESETFVWIHCVSWRQVIRQAYICK